MASKKSQLSKKRKKNVFTEGLSFSDYFDDSIPYDVKPIPSLCPMEESEIDYTEYYGYGYWMDSNGKLFSVGREEHLKWALQHLIKIGQNVKTSNFDPYEQMYRLGWVRIIIKGDAMYFNHLERSQVSPQQKRALEGLAISKRKELYDDTFHRYTYTDLLETSPIKLKSLIPETDYLSYKGRRYSWNNFHDSIAIICVYMNEDFKESYIASCFSSSTKKMFMCSNEEVETRLNDDVEFDPDECYRHVDLSDVLKVEFGIEVGQNELLRGRLFEADDRNYILGIWETLDTLKECINSVEEFLKRMAIDPKEILYTIDGNKNDKILSYNEVMGLVGKNKESNKGYVKLLQLAHTNDRVKQGLLKLPPNRLQTLADKLGIPLIKLKYDLGIVDESSSG